MKTRLPLLFALVASASFAAKTTVMVDAPPRIKGAIDALVKKKYAPVPTKGRLSADPDSEEVAKVARVSGNANAVVLARIVKGQVTVRVHSGTDGSVLAMHSFMAPGAKPIRALPAKTVERISQGLAKAAAAGRQLAPPSEKPPLAPPEPATPTLRPPDKVPPPPPPPPPEDAPTAKPQKSNDSWEKEAEPAPEPAPETTTSSSKAHRPYFVKAGGWFRGFHRRLYYVDDIFRALNGYELKFGPSLGFDTELFPGAYFSPGIASDFGAQFRFETMVGVASVLRTATTEERFATSSFRMRIRALGRHSFGPFEARLLVGYATDSFGIANVSTPSGIARPRIPNVAFRSLQVGLGGSIEVIDAFRIYAHFENNFVLDIGEIGKSPFFPHATFGGLETGGGLQYTVLNHLELRAGIEYLRFYGSLHPDPAEYAAGMNLVAGGALDDYFGFITSAAFVW